MQERSPYRGRVNSWRSATFFGIGIFLVSTNLTHAQDVAEAARQEQARKTAQKNSPKHVYTEEDLKKQKILTAEDEAKVAGKKQQEQAPVEQSLQNSQPVEQKSQTESLGEIARRYRAEKAARAAEEAVKENYTPFPIELPRETNAEPRASIAPIVVIRPEERHTEQPNPTQPVVPNKVPGGNDARARLSPFQPRPVVLDPRAVRVKSVPAVPVASVAPQVGADLRTVQVRPGESWWKLAAEYMGSGGRWTELRALNPDADRRPDLLRVGTTVLVPEGKTVQVNSSEPESRKSSLRIRSGDTLWGLAREHLGRASAWMCLANLNPQIKDYTRLTIGAALQLPERGKVESCGVPDAHLQR
jgi:nucleoid-associated protein YgaU